MESPALIGLIGRSRSGRAAVAAYLVERYGFVRLAYADKLKEILARAYQVPLSYFYDDAFNGRPHPNLRGECIAERFNADLPRWFESVLDELSPKSVVVAPAVACRAIFCDILRGRDYSPDEVVQLVGVEGFKRYVGESVWSDYVTRVAQGQLEAGGSVVISDVQFSCDLEGVRMLGGDLWAIKRAAAMMGAPDAYVGWLSNHADLIISNNGSFLQLHALIDHAIEHTSFSFVGR